jgi:hypothetical protein
VINKKKKKKKKRGLLHTTIRALFVENFQLKNKFKIVHKHSLPRDCNNCVVFCVLVSRPRVSTNKTNDHLLSLAIVTIFTMTTWWWWWWWWWCVIIKKRECFQRCGKTKQNETKKKKKKKKHTCESCLETIAERRVNESVILNAETEYICFSKKYRSQYHQQTFFFFLRNDDEENVIVIVLAANENDREL